MAPNPLKWPEFEQLGREFFTHLQPALKALLAADDVEELHPKVERGLRRVEAWLDSPCVATVKLDGTNVGIDDSGLLVGRNLTIEPGQTYQKVDVWKLFEGFEEKVKKLKNILQDAAGDEEVAQVMLYGELVVNSKYDYSQTGIHKGWLCFGAVVRPGREVPEQEEEEEDLNFGNELCAHLRKNGYNAKVKGGGVVITPTAQLASVLEKLNIRTVADGYRPRAAGSEDEWAAYHGVGSVPHFSSMRDLLNSAWLQRFLRPAGGIPLGEGLVVVSEADGTLFKLKHGGEELGKVPEQLAELVQDLKLLAARPSMQLPANLLEMCEVVHLIATTVPAGKNAPKVPNVQKDKEDSDALAVFESALTKFDDVDSIFEKGGGAKSSFEKDLIEQVTKDLIKDYACSEKDAENRSKKMVKTQLGRRFHLWKTGKSANVDG
eukprot:TRINITY_DN19144_c0_g1_i1.p1 TRINITY_DN19144_c0_g1~~TRINITY_DN19144_c0_g1_i1.p1  ORF type:complete len:434 (+),score=122.22 TRINITY_DN19144_c0_g1_i1:78-1379(+)